jgi:hypothetical protein
VARGEFAVGRFLFLGKDFDGSEEIAQAGANYFVDLLFLIAFGDHEQAMALGERAQRRFNGWQKLDLGGRDGFGEGDNAGVLFGRDGLVGELLEAVDK